MVNLVIQVRILNSYITENNNNKYAPPPTLFMKGFMRKRNRLIDVSYVPDKIQTPLSSVIVISVSASASGKFLN